MDTEDEIAIQSLLDTINDAFDEFSRAQEALRQNINEHVAALGKANSHHLDEVKPSVGPKCIGGLSSVGSLFGASPSQAPLMFARQSSPVPNQCLSSIAPIMTRDMSPENEYTPEASSATDSPRKPLTGDWDITGNFPANFQSSMPINELEDDSDPADVEFHFVRQETPTGASMMYLACRGLFVPECDFYKLSPWFRLAEGVLHTDHTLTCKLHNVWMGGITGDGMRLAQVVQAYSRITFAVRIEKAYRRVSSTLGDKIVHRHESLKRRAAFGSFMAFVQKKDFFGSARRAVALPMHPGSRTRIIWDSASMAVCFCDMILLPLLVFDVDSHVIEDLFQIFATVFWTLDILLSFSTAYFDGYTIQRRFRRIAESYLRSWFPADLLIVVVDWLFILTRRNSLQALKFAKMLKYVLRCVKLVRIMKVGRHYRTTLQKMNSEVVLTLVKIWLHATIVTMSCHYVACGWYAMHSVSGPETNWLKEYLSPDDSIAYTYCTCLHWALTQLLPASISVQPVNLPERVYNTLVIIVSMVMFSSFISNITVSMNHLRTCRNAIIERDGQLRRFLSQYEISNELSHMIWHTLRKSERTTRSNIKPAEVTALQKMPENLMDRVHEEAFLKTLQVHPLFDFYSVIEPASMTKLCRMGIEQRVLLRFEVLWHDLAVTHMAFVRQGSLAYGGKFDDLDYTVVQGEWCCEEALWSHKAHIEFPFTAGEMGCDLLMVNPDMFRTVAKSYHTDTHSFILLARYGEEFVRCFNESSHDNRVTKLLFNDDEMFMAMLKDATLFFQAASRLSTSSASS